MTVLSLRRVVREEDEAGTWVGLVPDGPIMLLAGAGAEVVDVLEEAGGQLARDRLVEAVLERFENAPPDAAREILRFVDELVEAGVLDAEGDDEAPADPTAAGEPSAAVQPSTVVEPSTAADAVTADETLVVGVAGEEVELVFTPGLEELAARARELWSHLLVDTDTDTGTGTGTGTDTDTDTGTGRGTDREADTVAGRSRRRYVPKARASGAARTPRGGDHADAAAPGPGSDAALRVLPTGPQGTYALSGDITRALIERLRGRRLLLHAAAVELPGTGVVLLVGPSGAGKSTAAETLARDGVYLTDELTILAPDDLGLSAYPKPVSHLDHGATTWAKRDHALPGLGLAPASRAEPPSHVVILEREATEATSPDGAAEAAEGGAGTVASTSTIERMPLHEAMGVLIGQSSSLWMVPDGLAALASLLERTGGALRARYQEAEDLRGLLAQAPAPASEGTTPIPVPDLIAAPGPGQWALAPFAQALAMDDGIQVLFEGRAVHAPALAGLVWEQLLDAGPSTIDEIVERIVVHLGPNPDSHQLVEASLGMLLSEGCVRRG
ncbi:hypothetical protein Bra3105_09575 [Brachybacterium halotolerans subsp. kimchii]|uniref:PqqD family peptide modification chaperone n=1 Tax=Brachybacterium halotolerans TaxID=2795215 RepID=UPI001E6421C9|nr:PqqD family peptide modification chaperone [Brachybacterium halotolerans]UEJ81115.1 hypothetical protein Bra3105_09575 [Brachybacterium halotolerans subsp. kimchii]